MYVPYTVMWFNMATRMYEHLMPQDRFASLSCRKNPIPSIRAIRSGDATVDETAAGREA